MDIKPLGKVIRGDCVFGNSGNTNSRVQNNSKRHFGSAENHPIISMFTINLFSHNSHSLNRRFSLKKNSTKMFFILLCILLVGQFGGKKQIKIKAK